MTVKAILDNKGRAVATIAENDTTHSAVKTLREKRIGAVVVVRDTDRIAGIFSERDLVRALADHGVACLDNPVSDYMTRKVEVCREDNTVNDVMEIMTRGRFRHLPVEADGRLAGIVSIGDVVKRRIEDVEREAEQIRNYIATA